MPKPSHEILEFRSTSITFLLLYHKYNFHKGPVANEQTLIAVFNSVDLPESDIILWHKKFFTSAEKSAGCFFLHAWIWLQAADLLKQSGLGSVITTEDISMPSKMDITSPMHTQQICAVTNRDGRHNNKKVTRSDHTEQHIIQFNSSVDLKVTP